MNVNVFLILASFLIFLDLPASSKDLGVYGQTFVIAEPDLLEEIQGRLSVMQEDGSLVEHQRRSAEIARTRMQRPQPVEGVSKAQTSRVFLFDPSVSSHTDLKDHQGRVFHKKVDRVNPLDRASLSADLLFIDGDDAMQQAWVQDEVERTKGSCKVILIKGAPFDLMEQWGRPVYFDQGGSLCKKLGLRHVPARVVQQGEFLQISEIALEEEGVK